jgi:hypothetical protein
VPIDGSTVRLLRAASADPGLSADLRDPLLRQARRRSDLVDCLSGDSRPDDRGPKLLARLVDARSGPLDSE